MRRKDRHLHRSTALAPSNAQPRPWAIRNAANGVPVIELFGDIGVSKAGDPWWGLEGGAGTFQEFAAELKKIGNVPELRVEIHSYGGSVTVGKGIHDKLLEHPANKTAVIYGICASAATYAALACQKVQIPANSFFLIHNSSGGCWGNAEDMRQCAAMLDVADDSIAALYAARTGKSLEEIQDIMDADTWMDGNAAVALGLADEVIEPITVDPEKLTAPENYRPALLNTMPEGARAWFDMSRISNAARAPLPMLKPNTPLFNAATESPPAGGSGAPAQPAAAPAAPAAPVNAAPVNAVPPAAPAAPDLATQITNAVNAAVAPLQAEIKRLTDLSNHGITPQNLGGAQPVAAVATEAPANTMKRDEWSKLSPLNRAEFIKKGGKLID
jgi:ATP-dependent protease ClpP protease subunit